MKRFLVPLSVLFALSACGPAIDGKWSTIELPAGSNWTVKYTFEFRGTTLNVGATCTKGTGYNAVEYDSEGQGPIKFVEGAFVVPETIEVRGYFDECDFDLKSSTYGYLLSRDGSTLTVFIEGPSDLTFYRD
ncbi:MAG: hypothetical protein AB1730_27105 [Myxococcota bacterium]|jgi:hypothetical protein